MTTALQKSRCCSAVSAAQHSENCSATSVFACGMLQGWGLEGWGLGLADFCLTKVAAHESAIGNTMAATPLLSCNRPHRMAPEVVVGLLESAKAHWGPRHEDALQRDRGMGRGLAVLGHKE